MMPYIQGDAASIPDIYAPYQDIVESVFVKKGDLGFLTIDESLASAGKPHRGQRAQYERALHTEAGKHPVNPLYMWGGQPTPGYGWGSPPPRQTPTPAPIEWGWGRPSPYRWGSNNKSLVTLDRDVKILLANNLDDSCAVWDAEHEDTSLDGDIGHAADMYPYSDATFLKAGEVHRIGILTPHESLPVLENFNRQFLRIISSGVHGREEYFTRNPLVPLH
ncbi:MAG: hypothetical protein ABA06_04185 [Parcubacteria bacterium C7867-001]|nr:MAG: hypothetical protein ABA06_04185 [Parcubacteria bacterium C7867-001]